MIGSWKLGSLFGITIRLHWSFLLLPLWVYVSSITMGAGTVAATFGVVLIFLIFGCVVLHELGHALTARQFGIGTRDITLLPIGGVAALERMPKKPYQELLIAIAGPAVNVVIAGGLFAFTGVGWVTGLLPSSLFEQLIVNLAVVNVLLVLFNLIPAFPMDGGRVLRSALATFMPYWRATRVAATTGQVVAAGFALFALLSGNLILLFVAGFVFLAAQGEKMSVTRRPHGPAFSRQSFATQTRSSAPPVQKAAPATQSPQGEIAVNSDTPATSVAEQMSASGRRGCEVVEQGRVIGYVTDNLIRQAMASGRGNWPVRLLLPMRG